MPTPHYDPIAEQETLQADLADARKRHITADAEGRRYLKARIREIQRDIRRNSMRIQDLLREDNTIQSCTETD